MTTRYAIKTNDGGWPLVRNGTNADARPVIVDDKHLFMTGTAAAEYCGCCQSTLSRALSSNGKRRANGHDARYATLEELTARLKPGTYVLAQAIPRRGSARDKTPAPPPSADPDQVSETPVFVGVEWPDGSVTVRLFAGGGEWQLTRAAAGDVPPEIAGDCAWQRFA